MIFCNNFNYYLGFTSNPQRSSGYTSIKEEQIPIVTGYVKEQSGGAFSSQFQAISFSSTIRWRSENFGCDRWGGEHAVSTQHYVY